MALQFASVMEMTSKATKKRASNKGKMIVLESVTRREQSLVLFHLLGRVLYNKRWYFSIPCRFRYRPHLFSAGKGDPPSSSTRKDIQKEKIADDQLSDPLPLPSGFEEHERRTSRINVEVSTSLKHCCVGFVLTEPLTGTLR